MRRGVSRRPMHLKPVPAEGPIVAVLQQCLGSATATFRGAACAAQIGHPPLGRLRLWALLRGHSSDPEREG